MARLEFIPRTIYIIAKKFPVSISLHLRTSAKWGLLHIGNTATSAFSWWHDHHDDLFVSRPRPSPRFRRRPWTRTRISSSLDNFASVVNPLKRTCGSIRFTILTPWRAMPQHYICEISSFSISFLLFPDCYSRGRALGRN